VHGEDAHGVVVALREDGLDDAHTFRRLTLRPPQVLAQCLAARLLPGAALVEDEPDPPPEVARPALLHRQLEHALVAHDALEHGARRQPVPLAVQPAEPLQSERDRMVRRGALGQPSLVVPPAVVARAPREEVVVAHTEAGGAQRGDDGEPVRRVVDGAGDLQQVADLARAVHERGRLDAIRHVGGVERGLEERQRRARRDEDGHVAPPGRAPLVALVTDGPLLAHRPADRSDDVPRLGVAQAVGVHRDVVERPGEQHRRPDLGRPPPGVERDVRRLRPR